MFARSNVQGMISPTGKWPPLVYRALVVYQKRTFNVSLKMFLYCHPGGPFYMKSQSLEQPFQLTAIKRFLNVLGDSKSFVSAHLNPKVTAKRAAGAAIQFRPGRFQVNIRVR